MNSPDTGMPLSLHFLMIGAMMRGEPGWPSPNLPHPAKQSTMRTGFLRVATLGMYGSR